MTAIRTLAITFLLVGCGVGPMDDPRRGRYIEVDESSLAYAVAAVGDDCAPGCIWSNYAIQMGAQPASHRCAGTACVCVVQGDVYSACNGATAADDAPTASPPPPSPARRPPATRTVAADILAAHDRGAITLWDQNFGHDDGADPLRNLRDAAHGRRASRSCHGRAPCGGVSLDGRLLRGMRALIEQYDLRYFVTSVAGASHSAGSLHYSGRAVDIDEVNGARVFGVSINGEHRAYPISIMNPHEMANDILGGEPIALAY